MVGLRTHQDVAVGEKKIIFPHKISSWQSCAACTVLYGLLTILKVDSESAPIAQVLFDHFGFPAGDEANIDNAGLSQATQNVFQDGLAFDPKHGLGGFLGQRAHAGPLPCCQDDCFHGLSPHPCKHLEPLLLAIRKYGKYSGTIFVKHPSVSLHVSHEELGFKDPQRS